MRYYDTDTPKRWDDGTELAVPEERIYGVGIPGLSDRVREKIMALKDIQVALRIANGKIYLYVRGVLKQDNEYDDLRENHDAGILDKSTPR